MQGQGAWLPSVVRADSLARSRHHELSAFLLCLCKIC
jgi:hypothetical protein